MTTSKRFFLAFAVGFTLMMIVQIGVRPNQSANTLSVRATPQPQVPECKKDVYEKSCRVSAFAKTAEVVQSRSVCHNLQNGPKLVECMKKLCTDALKKIIFESVKDQYASCVAKSCPNMKLEDIPYDVQIASDILTFEAGYGNSSMACFSQGTTEMQIKYSCCNKVTLEKRWDCCMLGTRNDRGGIDRQFQCALRNDATPWINACPPPETGWEGYPNRNDPPRTLEGCQADCRIVVHTASSSSRSTLEPRFCCYKQNSQGGTDGKLSCTYPDLCVKGGYINDYGDVDTCQHFCVNRSGGTSGDPPPPPPPVSSSSSLSSKSSSSSSTEPQICCNFNNGTYDIVSCMNRNVCPGTILTLRSAAVKRCPQECMPTR